MGSGNQSDKENVVLFFLEDPMTNKVHCDPFLSCS